MPNPWDDDITIEEAPVSKNPWDDDVTIEEAPVPEPVSQEPVVPYDPEKYYKESTPQNAMPDFNKQILESGVQPPMRPEEEWKDTRVRQTKQLPDAQYEFGVPAVASDPSYDYTPEEEFFVQTDPYYKAEAIYKLSEEKREKYIETLPPEQQGEVREKVAELETSSPLLGGIATATGALVKEGAKAALAHKNPYENKTHLEYVAGTEEELKSVADKYRNADGKIPFSVFATKSGRLGSFLQDVHRFEKHPEVIKKAGEVGEGIIKVGQVLDPFEYKKFKIENRIGQLREQDNESAAAWERGDLGFIISQAIADAAISDDPELAKKAMALRDKYHKAVSASAKEKPGMLKGLYLSTLEMLAPMVKTGAKMAVPVVGQAWGGYEWARQGTGDVYADLVESGVTHETARKIAPVTGIAYAAVEQLQFGQLANLAGKVSKELAGKSIKKAIMGILKEKGADYFKEVGEEGIQRLVTDVGTEIGKQVDGVSEKEVSEILWQTGKNVLEEMGQAAGPMGILTLLGIGGASIREVAERKSTPIDLDPNAPMEGDQQIIEPDPDAPIEISPEEQQFKETVQGVTEVIKPKPTGEARESRKRKVRKDLESGMSIELQRDKIIKDDYESIGLPITKNNFIQYWEDLAGEKISREEASEKIKRIWQEEPDVVVQAEVAPKAIKEESPPIEKEAPEVVQPKPTVPTVEQLTEKDEVVPTPEEDVLPPLEKDETKPDKPTLGEELKEAEEPVLTEAEQKEVETGVREKAEKVEEKVVEEVKTIVPEELLNPAKELKNDVDAEKDPVKKARLEKAVKRMEDNIISGVYKHDDAWEVANYCDDNGIECAIVRGDGRELKAWNTKNKNVHAKTDEEIKQIWGGVYQKRISEAGGIMTREQGDEFIIAFPGKTQEEATALMESIEVEAEAKAKEMGLDKLPSAKAEYGGLPMGTGVIDWGVSKSEKGKHGENDRLADSRMSARKIEKAIDKAVENDYTILVDQTTGEITGYEPRKTEKKTEPTQEHLRVPSATFKEQRSADAGDSKKSDGKTAKAEDEKLTKEVKPTEEPKKSVDLKEPVTFKESLNEVSKQIPKELLGIVEINIKDTPEGTGGQIYKKGKKLAVDISPETINDWRVKDKSGKVIKKFGTKKEAVAYSKGQKDSYVSNRGVEIIMHEVMGHAGASNVLRSNPKVYKRLQAMYNAPSAGMAKTSIQNAYKKELQRVKDRGGDPEEVLFSEWIAHNVERHLADPKKRGTAYKVYRAVRELLIGMGWTKETVDDAMESVVREIRRTNKFTPEVSTGKAIEVNTDAVIDEETDATYPRYSIRTWSEESKENILNKIVKDGIATEKKAKGYFKSLDNATAIILNDPTRLDYRASDLTTALKPNADPHYKESVDFSTLCKKRLLMQGTIEALQKKLGRGLSTEEFLAVRSDLQSKGKEVSCGPCYVESRRMRMGPILTKLANENPKIDRNLFLSQEGLDELKRSYPGIHKELIKRSAPRGIKAQESRTEYRGEILKQFSKKPKKVEDYNERAGLRWQSWSDFEVPHLLDGMQAITDMWSVGLKGHGYTKVPDFVRVYGETGLMINMSLIAEGKGVDKNGKLIFDSKEGMSFEEAKKLRKKYPETAGTIAIGISDEHINALLDSPDIDYIIPYHHSGLGKETRLKIGLDWKDYTAVQTPKVINKAKNVKAGGKINSKGKLVPVGIDFYEFWDGNKTPEQNVKAYKKLANERGLQIIFPDFKDHPNYWKFLIDKKTFDNDGNHIEQNAVTPKFNDRAIKKILDEYTGTHEKLPVDNATVKKIEKGVDTEVRFAKEIEEAKPQTKTPAFYSPTERTISELKQEKGVAQQIKSMIKKGQFKKAEAEWMGLEEYLNGNPKATKSDVLDFVRSNQVEVEESELGAGTQGWTVFDGDENQYFETESEAKDYAKELGLNLTEENYDDIIYPANYRSETSTKYSQYTLPGGENYRELLFKMPVAGSDYIIEKSPTNIVYIKRKSDDEIIGKYDNLRQAQRGIAKLNEIDYGAYKSSHWEEPNVFAHARVNDRVTPEGEKVLFIEEIQSDWAREARERGIGGKKDVEYENSIKKRTGMPFSQTSGLTLSSAGFTTEEIDEYHSYVRKSTVPGVPDFPHRKNWQEYVLKNILRKASEQGYDRVAWISGEQTADRYDLSKQVDMVGYKPSTKTLSVYKNGQQIQEIGDVTEKNISDYIGKDSGRKIIDQSNEWLDQIPEPDSVRKQFTDFFGAELPSGIDLASADGSMISVLHNDKISRGVISNLPVDVVNDLKRLKVSPQKLFSDKSVISDLLTTPEGLSVFKGVISSLRKIHTDLRAKLFSGYSRGADVDLFPTLKASNLTTSEALSLAFPDTFHHLGEAKVEEGLGTATPTTKTSTLDDSGKRVTATLTDFVDWHNNNILGKQPIKQPLISLKGDDLKVSPNWAKNLYDKQIPQFLKKYTKKWGGEVESVDIGQEHDASQNQPFQSREKAIGVLNRGGEVYVVYSGSESLVLSEAELKEEENDYGRQADSYILGDKQPSQPQQSISITPEMRESIMETGQPLFAKEIEGAQIGGIPAKSLQKNEAEAVQSYESAKNLWFGEKDWRVLKNQVEARKLQTELKEALGEKKFGEKAKLYDQALQVYMDTKRSPEDVEKYKDKLTPTQKHILKLSQNLPPALKKIADKIDKSYQETGVEALDADVIKNTLENYVGRVWDLEEKKGKPTVESMRKFGVKTGHAKKRTFATILEGWAAGYNLKVKGATNNLQVLQDSIIRTVEDKRFLKALQKIKTIDGDPLVTTKQQEGYVKIDHPNFTVWRHAGKAEEGESYGKNFFIDDDGNIFEKKDLYAPKEQAKNLNNILGTSKLRDVPGVKLATKYNAIFKAWILQSSFFHHLAYIRSYELGTLGKKINEIDPVSAYKQGLQSIEEESPIVRQLVKNGLTLGIKQDWQESLLQEKTLIGNILDKTKATKAVKDKILDLRQAQADFLFGEFGAGLKAKAAMIEYRNLLKKHPNMDTDTAAKLSANLINDDFGGLHLGRLGRNPTLQHIFRLFALAPDWTESNIRAMVKSVKAGSKEETAMYRKFWAGIITKGVLLTVMANALLSLGSDDPDDDFFKKTKKAWGSDGYWNKLRWLDIDITRLYKALGGKSGNRKYFSIIGHFKDPVKFMTAPIRSAHHKGSVLYKTIHEALVGKDWAGRRFTTLSEIMGVGSDLGVEEAKELKGQTVTWKRGKGGSLGYKQLPSYAVAQLKGTQPVQVQNLMNYMAGEMEGFDALTNSLGLGVATTYGAEEGEYSKYKSKIKKVVDDYKYHYETNKEKAKDFADKNKKILDMRKSLAQTEKDIRKYKKIRNNAEKNKKKELVEKYEKKIKEAAKKFNDAYYEKVKK